MTTQKQIQLIRSNGEIEVFEKPLTLRNMQEAVGGYIEHVKVLDKIEAGKFIYTSMFVDEEGVLDRKPRNNKATEIYLRNAKEQIKRGVHNSIFSDLNAVFIAGDVIFFSGYTCEEVDELFISDLEI